MASLFHALTNLGDLLPLTICRPSYLGPLPAVASEHAPWEDIPGDVMDLISPKLGLSDRLALGKVCKSWRSLQKEYLSPVRELPWLVLPHDPESRELCCLNMSKGSVEKLRLPEPLRDAEFIASTNGWLAFLKIDPCGKPPLSEQSYILLFNPVTRDLLKLPDIPKTSCFNYYVSDEDDVDTDYIFRIAISSSQIKESTMVAAIFGLGEELAVCKPGDEQWTIFTGSFDLQEYAEMMESVVEDDTKTYRHAAIQFRKETLFVLHVAVPHEADESSHYEYNGIYFLGSLKLHFINVVPIWEAEHDIPSLCSDCLLLPYDFVYDATTFVGQAYMTLSVQDELLLALQWCAGEEGTLYDDLKSLHSTKRFVVFKLDVDDDGEGGVVASLVKHVGDQALFLGGSGSRVVDSKEFSGIQANSVYFLQDWPLENVENDDDDWFYMSRDCGEYNLINDKVVRSLPSAIESFHFHMDWFSPN